MLDWFRKKKPRSFPVDSRWTVLQGQHNGNPLFVRRNDSAKELAGHPDFRFRVGVAVPLKSPDGSGFPFQAEAQELCAIEDLLSSQLESEQRSLQVLAITTGGMREFVFYTRDPVAAQAALDSVRARTTSHELQTYIQEDPGWDVLRQFA